jgi:hypothetical protein
MRIWLARLLLGTDLHPARLTFQERPKCPGQKPGFDALTATNTVSQFASPEPLTSVLGLGGLIAIGLVRRYRSIR